MRPSVPMIVGLVGFLLLAGCQLIPKSQRDVLAGDVAVAAGVSGPVVLTEIKVTKDPLYSSSFTCGIAALPSGNQPFWALYQPELGNWRVGIASGPDDAFEVYRTCRGRGLELAEWQAVPTPSLLNGRLGGGLPLDATQQWAIRNGVAAALSIPGEVPVTGLTALSMRGQQTLPICGYAHPEEDAVPFFGLLVGRPGSPDLRFTSVSLATDDQSTWTVYELCRNYGVMLSGKL
ncbi:hypothetical protein [Amorphus sp. 3PC139-8]|uniref:hypothetical protein n=1 Tax=Amorphus sp. 3PC139-8 TaxID=2735676 RepID=UPI00345D1161